MSLYKIPSVPKEAAPAASMWTVKEYALGSDTLNRHLAAGWEPFSARSRKTKRGYESLVLIRQYRPPVAL